MQHQAWDCEANWTINLVCNFNCTYCFSRADKDPPLTGKIANQQLAEFFEKTGLRWHLLLTGGEPFLYDGFTDLCELLTRKQFLSINTNGTSNRIEEFARTCDPERVVAIMVGRHPDERGLRSAWRILERNLLALRSGGFPVFACMVMTPEGFALYEESTGCRRLGSFWSPSSCGVPTMASAIRTCRLTE